MHPTGYGIAIARSILFFVVNRNRNQKPNLEPNGGHNRNYNRIINRRFEWTLKQLHLILFYVLGDNSLWILWHLKMDSKYFSTKKMLECILWNGNMKQFLKGETSVLLPACILWSLCVPQNLWHKHFFNRWFGNVFKMTNLEFCGCQIIQNKKGMKCNNKSTPQRLRNWQHAFIS